MTETLRCAQLAYDEQLDPVGSAPIVAGYLLVSWPLPWPSDVSDVPELVDVVRHAKQRGIRVQLVTAAVSRPMVALFDRDASDSTFSGFRPAVQVVDDPRAVVTAARQLLDYAGSHGAAVPAAPAAAWASPVTDVLVCTHGRRDRCCGALGTPLHDQLAALVASRLATADPTAPKPGSSTADPGDSGRLEPGRSQVGSAESAVSLRPVSPVLGSMGSVRIWRTSHTGGHRFAPTVILLPEGTAWAFADVSSVRQAIDRTGDFADLAPRYRGCSGLPNVAGQVLERIALEEEGWSVLDTARHVETLDGRRHRLTVAWPDGRVGVWEASVEIARHLTFPACGSRSDDPAPPAKPAAEYVARRVARWTADGDGAEVCVYSPAAPDEATRDWRGREHS